MKLKNNILFLFTTIFIYIMAGCEDSDSPCFSRTGEVVSEFRELTYFDQVEVNEIFDIVLIEDSANFIEVTYGEGLIQFIQTTVSDDDSTLSLINENSCRWTKEYERPKVKIHYTGLERVYINSPCHLSNVAAFDDSLLYIRVFARLAEVDLNVDCDRFELITNYDTYGVYRVKGNTFHAILVNDGASVFYCEDLISTWGDVHAFGLGDIYITTNGIMNYGLDSYGNIYYHGQPTLNEVSHKGDGKLIYLD